MIDNVGTTATKGVEFEVCGGYTIASAPAEAIFSYINSSPLATDPLPLFSAPTVASTSLCPTVTVSSVEIINPDRTPFTHNKISLTTSGATSLNLVRTAVMGKEFLLIKLVDSLGYE